MGFSNNTRTSYAFQVGRPCTICRHPDSQAIVKDLIAGRSYRQIGAQYHVNPAALTYHLQNHISAPVQRLIQAETDLQRDILDVAPTLHQLQRLNDHLRKLALLSEANGDFETAISAHREVRRGIELLARIRGELSPSAVPEGSSPLQVNIIYSDKPLPEPKPVLDLLPEPEPEPDYKPS
jgi:hypothetical protein